MSELRSRIEAARSYAGISSQAKLADLVDMKPATFNRRLDGTYTWRRGELLAIAEVCGVPIEFLEHGWAAFDVKAEYTATSPGEGRRRDAVDLGKGLRRARGGAQDDVGHG